ncbi:MAG TPA: methionine synthase [Actinomycetes bacterium]|nr:methionine synthase [Actinomycetes bacterium]
MADDFGYHIDHHGSLVRPAELLAARAGADPRALAEAERDAVTAIVHVQRRLGLSAVGDGQLRRAYVESVVHDGVDGFGTPEAENPLAQLAGIPSGRRRSVAGTPVAKGRLAEHEASLVLATTQRPVFVTLPSPGYLAVAGGTADSSSLAAAEQVGPALAGIIRQEAAALAAQGVVYVPLANPLYAPLLTVAGRHQLRAAGLDVDAALELMARVDDAVFDGLDVPDDFRLGLDLTDSGPLPTTDKGWDLASLHRLLDGTRFRRICVDFPRDPQARLPLHEVKPGLVVSLGVVDVTDPAEESVEELLPLCDAAVEVRGTDDVAISTNAGFAQAASDGRLSAEQQKAKLRLVETLARYYWGNEI